MKGMKGSNFSRWLGVCAMAILVVSRPAGISPDLVISQVYGGGGNAGAQFTHDFVELFNRGSAPASLNGMSIQYTSATGTGTFGANDGQLTPLPDVTLQPGQYYLVQESTGGANGAPLPSPDLVDPTPILMAAGAGKVTGRIYTLTVACMMRPATRHRTQRP